MPEDEGPVGIRVHALSIADALGYRGQKSVSDAMGGETDYRLVGGHMVRLLLHVYPTPAAILRSTLDADAALGSVEVVSTLSHELVDRKFIKQGGNLFYQELGDDHRIEINVIMSREGPTSGIRPVAIPGVGQVDTLPELRFALMVPGLVLDVQADLGGGEVIEYRTQVPDIEAAVVLKAHSWKERRSEKDLTDLHSLLEIREAHPDTSWGLSQSDLIGFRRDTAAILRGLSERVVRKNVAFPVPRYLNRLRFAALIAKHVG